MSYQNFIPEVWAKGIQRALKEECVFMKDCNTSYEGQVRKEGDSVKILGIGKVTITHGSRADANKPLSAPEVVEDTAIHLPINQYDTFNYLVGDIDEAQAKAGENVMSALDKETTEGLADQMDKYIANMVITNDVAKVYKTAPTISAKDGGVGNSDTYVLDVLDKAREILRSNKVKATTKIVATVSPRFMTLLRKAYREIDTNNSELLKKGYVGMYNGIYIRESCNVCTTKEDGKTIIAPEDKLAVIDNIMVRTERAVAFVNPHTHVEAYRPDDLFADCVKGYNLYDGKVVRPAEIVNVNVQYKKEA